jgi:hypothetical protein
VTDDEIRALVRVAIRKHLGAPAFAPGASADPPAISASPAVLPPQPPFIPIAFSRYALPRAEDDTMCIIEPAMNCNHCGYCQCHGH